MPSLETAIALEVIFGAPLRELYAGVYDEVEQAVMERIFELSRLLGEAPKCERVEHQLNTLEEILKKTRQ
jgi:hypothetical protein